MASKDKPGLKKHSTTKTKFTLKFISSLSKIKRANNCRLGSSSYSTNEDIRRRSSKIKVAAYSCMARAVGSKRVWSRSVLFNVRNRARLQGNKCLASKKKKRSMIRSKNKVSSEMGRANMLRGLVPGGENMDLCELLSETAHYVKCLVTQVKVMQSIVDHYEK